MNVVVVLWENPFAGAFGKNKENRMAVENDRLHQIQPWKCLGRSWKIPVWCFPIFQDYSHPQKDRGANSGPLHQHRSTALVHQEQSRDGGEDVDHT